MVPRGHQKATGRRILRIHVRIPRAIIYGFTGWHRGRGNQICLLLVPDIRRPIRTRVQFQFDNVSSGFKKSSLQLKNPQNIVIGVCQQPGAIRRPGREGGRDKKK